MFTQPTPELDVAEQSIFVPPMPPVRTFVVDANVVARCTLVSELTLVCRIITEAAAPAAKICGSKPKQN